MSESRLRFVRRCAEFRDKSEISQLKRGLHGIYVLYKAQPSRKKKIYDVQYIGIATGRVGFRSRLTSHAKSKRKGKSWTHFSIFEVWGNVTNQEIRELEGIARHIYRRDPKATLNIQRGYERLRDVRDNKIAGWISD